MDYPSSRVANWRRVAMLMTLEIILLSGTIFCSFLREFSPATLNSRL